MPKSENGEIIFGRPLRTQPLPDLDENVEFIARATKMDKNNEIFQQRHTMYAERRRQANWAFNLTWGLTGISGLVGIAAALLLFSGRVSEGMFTAAGGGIYGCD